MSRKILCPSCGSILNEDILKHKNSENTCLVCGANLNGDESESTPEEEELVTWYYYEFKDGSGAYSLRDKPIDLEKFGDTYELKYKFQAPPRDNENGSEAAKEVLRREYKPDAFMESESSSINKPDAFWIAEGKCPRCHSDNIQLIPRKFSIWTGFRTNKVDRVCVRCKHRF